MRRINTLNKDADAFGPGKHGWKNGVPGTVNRPTEGQAEWFNALQEEVAAVVEGAGMPLDPDDSGQMNKALRQVFRQRDLALVTDYGAKGDGVIDDHDSLLAAKAHSARVRFPRINNQLTTYYIGALAAGDLDGLVLSADDGVTISFASNAPYSLYKAAQFETDVNVHFRDIGIDYKFKSTPRTVKKESPALAAPLQRRVRLALDCTNSALVNARSNNWPAADDFPAAASALTTDTVSISAGGAQFKGAFVEIGCYETVSALFNNGDAPGPIGVMVRGTLGFTVIYSGGAAANYATGTKLTGAPVSGPVSNLTWANLGQGSYSTFAPGRSLWSVSKVSASRVIVKVNGKALTSPFAAHVGDIHEVGFVCYTNAAFSISGLTIERRTDAVVGMQQLDEIRIFGDSTAERFPSSWDQQLRQLLDGLYGVRVGVVTNFAVAGQTLDQQYAAMLANGLGNAYYVPICAGTNNAQGLQALADWKTVVANTIDYVIAQGRRPVIVVPWLWYTQAQSGGSGQNSTNYDLAAPYRLWLERIAFERGVVVVKTTDELPNPSPALLGTDPGAALLRDNIHQDLLGHQLYALAIARAIADDYMAMPGGIEEAAGPLAAAGATPDADFRICYTRDGSAYLNGTVSVTAIANGTSIMRLPRYLAPGRQLNVAVLAIGAGPAPLGMCWLLVDPVTASIKIQGAPAGTTKLIMAGAKWQVAASVG